MAAYLSFVLGPVQLAGGGPGSPTRYGFSIATQRRPLFFLGYVTQADAEAGRDAVEKALAAAVEVVTQGM